MIILSRLAVQRRAVTVMMLLLVLAGGVYAYQQLRQELFPEIKSGLISVTTTYQQGSPYEVAEEVTGPIEDLIIGMDGVEEVTSTSRSNLSQVWARFATGADLTEAEAEIISRVSALRLPDAAGKPRITEITSSLRPVMELSISGQRDSPELLKITERDIIPRLEAVRGVSAARTVGGVSEQLFVSVDPEQLEIHGLTIQHVIRTLRNNAVDATAGSVATMEGTVPLRAFHGYSDLETIRNLPVGFASPLRPSGQGAGSRATPVRLSEVAEVRVDTPAASSVSRTNGRPSVGLNVHKDPDGNTIDVTAAVEQVLTELADELPPDVVVTVMYNQGPGLEEELNKVTNQGIQGFIFAIIAVFVFLLQIRPTLFSGIFNTLRPTVIIAVSIPLSVMVTMLVMLVFDWTLNFMSLAGLAIAVGRIVDDSIVVLENIYRHLQSGSPRATAVIEATREVSPAIVASTLTTVAVFIPLAFVPGIVGQFFLPFAQTVCVSLVASTLVALTSVPALAALILRQGAMATDPDARQDDTLLQKLYTPVLRLALRFRMLTVLLSIAVVLASLSLILVLPIELFSPGNIQRIRIELSLDQNPSAGELFREVREVESLLDEFAANGIVTDYQVTLDSSSASFGSGGSNASYDRAGFIVQLGDEVPPDLDEQIRGALPSGGNVTARVFADRSGPSGGDATFTLTGSRYEDVRAATNRLYAALEGDPGIRNLRSDIVDGAEEFTVVIDPNEAARRGLSTLEVANQIRTWVSGSEVAEVDLSGETLDVVVRGKPEAVDDADDIPLLPITGNAGTVPLGAISDERHTVGPAVITHHNGDRSATISAELAGRDAGATGARLGTIVAETPLPAGVAVRAGGAHSDLAEEFANVYLAMGIGIAMVYLVMVATLGSLKIPFIIVLSLPLAVVGALAALAVTDRSLSVPALMGFLLLAGIVVTNAIVLLTFVQQLRQAGYPPLEAVMTAGRTRLRPILMTAFTTIVALVPLALSDAFGLVSAELATVVIGGLLSSTFLTLVAVPVTYMLFEESVPNLFARMLNFMGRRTQEQVGADPDLGEPAGGVANGSR